MKAILLFASLLILGHGAPLITDDVDQCSKQCSEAENLFYEIDKTYVYNFDTKNTLKFENQDLKLRVTGTAKIFAAKKCEFRLKLENVKIEGMPDDESLALELQRETLTFAFDDGKIRNVCPSVNERSHALNIKKAILSAMQVSTKIVGPLKVVEERDILGDCDTTYSEVENKGLEGMKIVKTKNFEFCRNRMNSKSFILPAPIVERIAEKMKISHNDYKCTQKINKEGIMESVTCTESTNLHFDSKPYARESSIEVVFEKTENSIIPEPSMKMKMDSLLYTKNDEPVTELKNVHLILKDLCESVKHDIRADAPRNFRKLTCALKGLEYDDINKLVSQVRMENGIHECQSMKLKGLLESALMMSGGRGALRYMTEDIKSLDIKDPKKLSTILSLPLMPNPTEETVKALLPFLKNVKSPKMTLLATSLIGNFVRKNGTCPSKMPAVIEAVNTLGNRLQMKCFAKGMTNDDVITYLKSIGNIGYMSEEVTQKIVSCAKSSSTPEHIRISAVDTLRKTGMCNAPGVGNEVKALVDILMSKAEETDEMKISAFRTMMECGKGLGEDTVISKAIEIMKHKNNKQFGYYVYSYLFNLKKDKSPEKRQLRQAVLNKEIKFDAEGMEIEKLSRNHAFSYFASQLGLGLNIELNYVFNKGTKFPRSLNAIVKVPLYDDTMQLIEIGLRQDGNDANINEVIEFFKSNKMEDILMNIKHLFDKNNEQSVHELNRKLKSLLANLKMVSMYLDINGNTLFCGSFDDFERFREKRQAFIGFAQGRGRPSQIYASNELIQAAKNFYRESGYGMLLLDSSFELPTVSGMPILAAAKMPMVFGSTSHSADKNVFNPIPNFAATLCLSVSTYLKRETKLSIKWKLQSLSNFRINTKTSFDGVQKSIELSLPKREIDMFVLKSGFSIEKESVEQSLLGGMRMEKCSSEFMGVKSCLANNQWYDGRMFFKWALKQSDPSMTGWKAMVTYPGGSEDPVIYSIQLSTPKSTVERHLEVEIKEVYVRDGNQYSFKIKSPSMNANGDLMFNLDTRNRMNLQLKFNVNDRKHLYEMSFAPKVGDNGMMMFAKMDNQYMSSPLEISFNLIKNGNDGSMELLYTQNRNEVSILKGMYLVQESSMKSTLQLGNSKINQWINFNVALQMNDLSLDTSIDYKTKQMTKIQKIDVHGKVLDKGTSDLLNVETIGEMTFTQWPQFNCHLKHSIMYKRNEHCENELLLKWSGKMDSEKRQIRIHQIAKKMPQVEEGTEMVENRITVFIGPKSINQEISYIATCRKTDLILSKHEVKMTDLNSGERREGLFKFEMLSKTPLKAHVDLAWKCPSGEKSLKYEIAVVQPNRWKETLTVKHQMTGKPVLGYVLQSLTSKTFNNSYFDVTMTLNALDSNERLAKFTGLLELGKTQRLMSKLQVKGKQVYDLHHLLDMNEGLLKNSLHIDELGKTSFIGSASPSAVNAKLLVKCHRCNSEHESDFNFIRTPERQYDFHSKTTYKGKMLYNININHILKKSLQAELFNDNFNSKLNSEINPTGYVHTLNYQKGDLLHKSMLIKENEMMSFASDTRKGDKMLMEAKYRRESGIPKLAKLIIPSIMDMQYENSDHRHYLKAFHEPSNLLHETTFTSKPNEYHFNFESKIDKESDNIYDLKLLGIYEKPDQYELKTSLGVMKGINFNMGLQSSDEEKAFILEMNDELISKERPISYGIRALRTPTRNSVSVSNQLDKYGVETLTDEDKSFIINVKTPMLTSQLKLHDKNFKFVVDAGDLQHETSLEKDDTSSKFNSITKIGEDIMLLLKRTKTQNKLEWEVASPLLELHMVGERLSLKEDKVTIDWEVKMKKKRRSLLLEKKEIDDKLQINLILKTDLDDPSKVYSAVLTAPLRYERKLDIKLESKGPNVCDADISIEYDSGRKSYEMLYSRKCAEQTINYKMSREISDKNYHHLLEIKQIAPQEKLIFAIDTKAKLTDDKKTLTVKSQITSANKDVDGAYLDYKRQLTDNSLQVKFALKPIFLKHLTTIDFNVVRKQKRGITNLQLHSACENLNTGRKGMYDLVIENENNVLIDAKYSVKEAGETVPKVIASRKLVAQPQVGILIAEWQYTPINSYGNISLIKKSEELAEMNIILVHRGVDLIRMEGIINKATHEVNSKGTMFGYPISTKLTANSDSSDVTISVKPIDPSYPYKAPEKYRISDCYNPSSEDCITLHYITDNRKRVIKEAHMKLKVNRDGEKYTSNMEYKNEDDGDKKIRKVLITNDKDSNKLGFDVLHSPNECEANIYLKEGRVIRYTRKLEHTSSPDGLFSYKITKSVWFDHKRKPNQKLTVENKFERLSDGINMEVTISHPIYPKPITIKGKGKESDSKRTLNVVFDYSSDPNDKIYLDVEYEKKSVANPEKYFTKSVKVYREDRKLDFQYDMKQITQFTPLGTIAEVFKNSQWKGSDGAMKSVLSKVDVKVLKDSVDSEVKRLIYNQVYKKLSHYLSIDAEIVKTKYGSLQSIDHIDLAFLENGPKYRLNGSHISNEDEYCFKLNGFHLPLGSGPMKYVKYCAQKSQKIDGQPFVQLSAGDEATSDKTFDFNLARKPNEDRVYIVTLLWNPERVQNRIAAFIEHVQTRINSYINAEQELEREKEFLRNTVLPSLEREVLNPMQSHLSKELKDIAKENPKLFSMIPIESSSHRHRRSVVSGRPRGRDSKLLALIKTMSTFRMISYNPQKGEIIFEIGSKYL